MEELKIEYTFDLEDFKEMENIEHSYFPDENITMKLPVEVIISCNSLLPIGINLLLDEFISKALQNEYIDKYLSNKVVVNQAKGSVSIEMNYGYFTIEGLTEKDKQEYKEYK